MLKTLFHISRKSIVNPVFGLFFLFLSTAGFSQGELLLNVSFDDSQYPIADKTVFEELKLNIEEFVNNRKWTEDQFDEDFERINFNLLITVGSNSTQTGFFCQAVFQSSRPVYNSGYESSLLNFIDKDFDFSYTTGDPLIFNENTYTNELTSLLAFYSYMALGLDYNSFGLNGGKEYFQQALTVKNAIPNQDNSDGWKRNGDVNNRNWLVENAINAQFDDFHSSMYNYHRLGLDQIAEKQKEARQEMFKAIKALEKVFDLNPESVLISSFFLAKRVEIVLVFKEADQPTKDALIPLLRKMDPANSAKYQKIKS